METGFVITKIQFCRQKKRIDNNCCRPIVLESELCTYMYDNFGG